VHYVSSPPNQKRVVIATFANHAPSCSVAASVIIPFSHNTRTHTDNS